MSYLVIEADMDAIFQKQYTDGLSDENFELFIQYFSVLTEENQGFVNDYLSTVGNFDDSINTRSLVPIEGVGYLYFQMMIYLGRVENAIDYIYSNVNDGKKTYSLLNLRGHENILNALNSVTKNIYAQKVSELIERLTIESFYSTSFNELKEKTQNKILMRKIGNIKLKVNQVDVEIQSDQNEVVKLIQEFGFEPKLNKYLTDLSSKNISEEDRMTFAGAIATYREFFGNMMIEISDKIVEILGEEKGKYPDGSGGIVKTPIGISRKHIKEKLQLSDGDNALINKYMDIVHDEGGHNMFSSQTYFRLTKNIGIEILYMLLSKLKELEKLRSS